MLKLRQFIGSSACATRAHCITCRDKEGGRQWRESLRVAYQLPDDQVDFECPYHVPWGASTANIPPPPKPGPGDVVKAVLRQLGYTAASNCGCEAKRQEMNALGWWGCWRKRAELAEWFAAKAAAQGITVDRATIPGLLLAAWRENSRRNKPNTRTESKPRP